MKDKQKLKIIEKALALGAEIHITDEGDKTIIEIKKGEPAPLTVKNWTTPSPITITPTWGARIVDDLTPTNKWDTRTADLTTCETQKD